MGGIYIEPIISPIFYMGNKKKLIKKGLTTLFPSSIDTFIDLFAGSAIVSMNTVANRYVINDIDINLNKFYRMFRDNSSEDIIYQILSNIEKFGLKRTRTEQDSPDSEEYKQRYIHLRNYANQTKDWIDIYTCMFYAFSQQMRFNSHGLFNMPFGNRAFNEQNEIYIQNGCEFFSENDVFITQKDFREIKVDKLKEGDFVYLDPPYLNTTATYTENGGWSQSDEDDLLTLCEQIDSQGLKFGLSNVFSCKGKENTYLTEWCKAKGWNVCSFDKFTYMACGKGNANAKEVYICNY